MFTFTFTLWTIYEFNDTDQYLEKCSPATDNGAIIATLLHHEEDKFSKMTVKNGSKIDRKNPFRTNVRSDILRNDRRQFPYLAHQKTTRISSDIFSLPWRWSILKRTSCIIWRRWNILLRGMASLQLWCNSKRRTKHRNWWRNNSGPWHQHRQGRIWFLFSVSFTCTIFFSLPYPRTPALPQK